MGWERKRGKLAQFNRFLRGGAGAHFAVIGGRAECCARAATSSRSTQTRSCRGRRAALVGTIAHPLNRAEFDPKRGRVTEATASSSRGWASRSRARTGRASPPSHSGHPGVDPYTTAVSDVYQDLFGEGSFTGKGIYDVDAFERATHGRFPENTLLSHDLIEGSFARAGLATDIEVFDDYPARYLTFARRKHRWIRGDWQLLRWLTPHGPGSGRAERNPLSAISRWKILDNLRRSPVEIAQLATARRGWTLLPGSPLALDGGRRSAMIALPWLVPLAARRCCVRRATNRGARTTWRSGATRQRRRAAARARAASSFRIRRAIAVAPSCARCGVSASRVAISWSGRRRRRWSGRGRRVAAWRAVATCGRRRRARCCRPCGRRDDGDASSAGGWTIAQLAGGASAGSLGG